MSYYTPLPARPAQADERFLNIVDGQSTAVQRSLRRTGIAGYEPATVAAILALWEAQRPGFMFYDVGANVGLYSAMCASLFDVGGVVAFEPTPETARIAEKIMRINALDVHVEEIALGVETGTASLYLYAKSDASNSLVEGFKENVGTVDVRVETLDAYVENSRRIPDVIKIDAETFEPEILRGARETLRTHRPSLLVEVLNRRGHDHGEEMMDVMDGLGYSYYRCSAYSDWNPRPEITGDLSGEDRDWLLAPGPVDPKFRDRVEAWELSISECTADRNRASLGQRLVESTASDRSIDAVLTKARRLAERVRRRVV